MLRNRKLKSVERQVNRTNYNAKLKTEISPPKIKISERFLGLNTLKLNELLNDAI